MIMRFTFVAAFALVTAFAVAPAHAAVCQGTSMTIDEIVTTITAATSCDAGMKIFNDCSLGSGGDLQLGDAVREKCEGDFLSRLKEPEKQIYQRELRVCSRKYANQSGTMYRSFEAFCGAEVAQRYSRKALKLSPPPKR